jgi:hypothetical protein
MGNVRRECLDHVTVLQEQRLGCILTADVQYDHRFRTH